MKSHLRVGHGCSVGEVKGILQGVKLKLVANPSAKDILKVAVEAPGVIHKGSSNLSFEGEGSRQEIKEEGEKEACQQA